MVHINFKSKHLTIKKWYLHILEFYIAQVKYWFLKPKIYVVANSTDQQGVGFVSATVLRLVVAAEDVVIIRIAGKVST